MSFQCYIILKLSNTVISIVEKLMKRTASVRYKGANKGEANKGEANKGEANKGEANKTPICLFSSPIRLWTLLYVPA